MSDRADVVVVGSGPNGLAAAITLAEAGRDVVVLEAADEPGGAVRSAELTEPGFVHDVFSAVHPAGAASPVFARWPLADHGLEWVHPEAAMAHPMPDGSAPCLYRDLDATVASLDEQASGDGRGWRELAGPLVDAWPALRRSLLAGWVPVRGPAALFAQLRVRGMLEFARVMLAPAWAVAEERFASPGSRAWLLGSVHHADVPSDDVGSGAAGLYLQLLGHGAGWPSPRGGAGRLSQALVSYLSCLGGQVRTGARVEHVVTRRGRVAGVTTADGQRVRANVVIADTTPHALIDLAGQEVLGEYAGRLRRYRYGPGTVKLDWALDAPIPWQAPPARTAGTVHVGGAPEALRDAATLVKHGRLPSEPFLLVGQQTVADPTRAPRGKHTAWAYTRVPRGLDWASEAKWFVEAMEEQLERFAPGFADVVRARHVLLPPEFERRNASLVEGDVGNGTYELDQLVFRPVPSLAPYRTPVAGLYLGSAATFPGGAVHGVNGRAAARLALAESRMRWW